MDPITLGCIAALTTVIMTAVSFLYSIAHPTDKLMSGGPPPKALPESAEDRYYRLQKEDRERALKEFDDAQRLKYGPTKEEARVEKMRQEVEAMKSPTYPYLTGPGAAFPLGGPGGHFGRITGVPYPPTPPQYDTPLMSAYQHSILQKQQLAQQQYMAQYPPPLPQLPHIQGPDDVEMKYAKLRQQYLDFYREIGK